MCSTNIPTSSGSNAFLTTSTITLSCLASAAPQSESWWLGHVVPDDVVMADIGGQALHIFLQSAHKNSIAKTFTHTSIPIRPCTLITQTKSKTLNSPNMWPSSSILPVQCGGGRRPASLADAPQECSMSESFCPRTWQYWQKTFVGVFNKYSKIAWQQCPF